MSDREIFKTGPYKWQRDLISRIAKAAGCTHEFKMHVHYPEGRNVKKTEYQQIVTGDAIGAVDRAWVQALTVIEAEARQKYPGPHMFAKEAAVFRKEFADKMDAVALVKSVS